MKKSLASIMLMSMAAMSVFTLMTNTARAEIVVFTATLSPANEVAPIVVSSAEAGSSGTAIITLDITRSGSTITAATARFDVSVSGFPSNGSSLIILTHIHQGAATVNGPVRVDSGISPGAPIGTPQGVAAYSRSNLVVSPAVADLILNGPGGFYFNVHTALNPNGVMRGQLVPNVEVTGTAPTLSEWGMILMSLLFVAAGTFFLIGRRRVVAALGGADQSISFDSPVKALDFKELARVTMYVEALIALALIAIRPGITDVVGTVVSGLLVAFTVHLFIASSRRR